LPTNLYTDSVLERDGVSAPRIDLELPPLPLEESYDMRFLDGTDGDRAVQVLLVEDNPADVRLTREVLEEGDGSVRLTVVRDGEEAMAFIRRQGVYTDSPRPHLVLLDLNLPKKDGREVLEEIKGDASFRRIPVVVLTTSAAESDIAHSYELHANCFMTKPLDLDEFFDAVRSIKEFWITNARLPSA
jgi:two-component system, chemotaxis family, response regulator Rcp1